MSNSIVAFFTALEADVVAKADAILPIAEQFARTVISDIEIGLEQLAPIALNAVIGAASQVMSGSEKFGTAVTGVVQTVEAQGLTVAIQTAQMAVQAAYTAIQNATAQPPAPAA